MEKTKKQIVNKKICIFKNNLFFFESLSFFHYKKIKI